jgi:predicted transglutaminase-like cysteine proteinase
MPGRGNLTRGNKMGRAKIISGGFDGIYNVELVRDTARITTEIAKINARLAVLETVIQESLNARNAALDAVSAAQTALNIAIGQLITKQITVSEVNRLQAAHVAASKEYDGKFANHALLILEKESKTKRLALLQTAVEADYRYNIWCADLTENLAVDAEVGTIEINGEKTQILIYPGGRTSLTARLQPVLASTPAGVFYNRAILPGWQKFKPTFRTGTITALSGDLCTVSLDDALSQEQSLNINATSILSNVPIVYMTYNGAAFVVGDDVVIEFTAQDWTRAKVIGFAHDPRILLMLHEYLCIGQNGVIGRLDGFPDSLSIVRRLSITPANFDVMWCTRNNSFIVATPTAVMKVLLNGTIDESYPLTGTEASIFQYDWSQGRDAYIIKTGDTSYVQVDEEMNYLAGGYYDFRPQYAWKSKTPFVPPYPFSRIVSYARVGSDSFIAVAYEFDSQDVLFDGCSGYYVKAGETYDHGYGEPISVIDPAVEYEYTWKLDYKLAPYTRAELRWYHGTSTNSPYDVLAQLPVYDFSYVNAEAFYTNAGIENLYTSPDSWQYKKNYYDIGQFQRTLKTAGDIQKVTFYDPDGGPAPDNYPTADALIIVTNSGKTGIAGPSITVYDFAGNIVGSITPPSVSVNNPVVAHFPQKYATETTSTVYSSWYDFLQRHPTFALGLTTEETEIPYTAQLIADLADIQTAVNEYPGLETESPDYWEFMSVRGYGDCEDYALEKAKRLLDRGYPADALHLEIGEVRANGKGHAWLVVLTSAGAKVLDNLRSDVVSYSAVQQDYIHRARQTGLYWYFVE